MKTLTFHATGMQHYEDAIDSLKSENDDYSLSKSELAELYDTGKIWKYDYSYSKLELIPEPENEFDKNAVAVYLDGRKVAYIKKGSCSQVKNLLASGTVKGIDAEIGGGHYKYLSDDGDGHYTIEHDESPLYVHITFYVDDGTPAPASEQAQTSSREAPTVSPKKKRSLFKTIVRVFAVMFILFGALMVFIDPICAGFILLGIILIFCSK